MGFFNNLKLYFFYKKTIRKNRDFLLSGFNIRIDMVNRMYAVLKIPEEVLNEPYNTRTADIEMVTSTYIKSYVTKLSAYLNSLGLSELYDFYGEKIKKFDKSTYLVVIGFKPINSVRMNNMFWYGIFPILVILFIIGLVIFFKNI